MEISEKALCSASGKTVRKYRINEVGEIRELEEVKERKKRNSLRNYVSRDGAGSREETVRRAKILA
jgi:hypothetical protein